MRLHRFHIEGLKEAFGRVTVTNDELIHQWRNVFRMKQDDEAVLFGDNGVEYTCSLEALEKKCASWRVLAQEEGKRATHELILLAALVKRDNFELTIQKATEIGATRVIPIVSERSEKKGLNMERAQKIAIEACEQSGRVDIPIIDKPCGLDEALEMLPANMTLLSFEPTGSPFSIQAFAHEKIAVAIGPEGGWTRNELDTLIARGRVLQLPTFILRAETAAIATLTLAAALRPPQNHPH